MMLGAFVYGLKRELNQSLITNLAGIYGSHFVLE
jgi:hypothetical protein